MRRGKSGEGIFTLLDPAFAGFFLFFQILQVRLISPGQLALIIQDIDLENLFNEKNRQSKSYGIFNWSCGGWITGWGNRIPGKM
jgi:hypothetical protein